MPTPAEQLAYELADAKRRLKALERGGQLSRSTVQIADETVPVVDAIHKGVEAREIVVTVSAEVEAAREAIALAEQHLTEATAGLSDRLDEAAEALSSATERLSGAESDLTAAFGRIDDAEDTLAAIPTTIDAAKQAAVDAAAADAKAKADAAKQAAITAAAADAKAKADAAQTAAVTAAAADAKAKADAAQAAAASAAASDATSKANAAKQAAIDAAAVTAQLKADNAAAAAIAAAEADAKAKASAAQQAAVSAAAADAKAKADAAQAAATATAAADATSKANAARDAAVTAAASDATKKADAAKTAALAAAATAQTKADDAAKAALSAANLASTKGTIYAQPTEPAYDPNGLWIDTANGNIPRRVLPKTALVFNNGGGWNASTRLAENGWTVTTATALPTVAEASKYSLVALDSGYAALSPEQRALAASAFAAGVSVYTSGNDTPGIPPLFTGTASRGADRTPPIRPSGLHPAGTGWPDDSDTDLQLYLTGVNPAAVVTAVTDVNGVDRPEGLAMVDPTTGARWIHYQPYGVPRETFAPQGDWLANRWSPVRDAAIIDAANAAVEAQERADDAHSLAGSAASNAQTAITAAGTAKSAADSANAAAGAAQSTANSAQTAAGTAQTAADAAKSAANAAQTTANSKPLILFGTSAPSGTAPQGSTWFRVNSSGQVIGQWQQTAAGNSGSTWAVREVHSDIIANLDVGKLTAGSATIASAVVQKIAAATASIQRADIGNLFVSNTATIDTAVIEKLWADVVVVGLVTAQNLITGDAIVTGTLSGDKLAANAIDGRTITGGTIQSSPEAERGVKIDTGGISAYGPDGALKFEVDATTGQLSAQGVSISGDISGSNMYGGYIEAPVIASTDKLGTGANVLQDPNLTSAVDTAWVASGHTGDSAAVTQTDTITWDREWDAGDYARFRHFGNLIVDTKASKLTRRTGTVTFDHFGMLPTAARTLTNPFTYPNTSGASEPSWAWGATDPTISAVQVQKNADVARTSYLTNAATIQFVAGEPWNLSLEHAALGEGRAAMVQAWVQMVDATTSAVVWEQQITSAQLRYGTPVTASILPTATQKVKFRVKTTYLGAGGGLTRVARSGYAKAKMRFYGQFGSPNFGEDLGGSVPDAAGMHVGASGATTPPSPKNPTGLSSTGPLLTQTSPNATVRALVDGLGLHWYVAKATLSQVTPEKGWVLDKENGLRLYDDNGAQTGAINGADNFLAGTFATSPSGLRTEVSGDFVTWYDALNVGRYRLGANGFQHWDESSASWRYGERPKTLFDFRSEPGVNAANGQTTNWGYKAVVVPAGGRIVRASAQTTLWSGSNAAGYVRLGYSSSAAGPISTVLKERRVHTHGRSTYVYPVLNWEGWLPQGTYYFGFNFTVDSGGAPFEVWETAIDIWV